MPDNMLILLIVLVAIFLLIILFFGFVYFWERFSSDLDYINHEISRSSGSRKKYWKRERRKLFLSLIPVINRFVK